VVPSETGGRVRRNTFKRKDGTLLPSVFEIAMNWAKEGYVKEGLENRTGWKKLKFAFKKKVGRNPLSKVRGVRIPHCPNTRRDDG